MLGDKVYVTRQVHASTCNFPCINSYLILWYLSLWKNPYYSRLEGQGVALQEPLHPSIGCMKDHIGFLFLHNLNGIGMQHVVRHCLLRLSLFQNPLQNLHVYVHAVRQLPACSFRATSPTFQFGEVLFHPRCCCRWRDSEMPGRLTYSVTLCILHYVKLLLCAELDVLATFALKTYNSHSYDSNHYNSVCIPDLVAGMHGNNIIMHSCKPRN